MQKQSGCRKPLELFPDDFCTSTDIGETQAKGNGTNNNADPRGNDAKENAKDKEIVAANDQA